MPWQPREHTGGGVLAHRLRTDNAKGSRDVIRQQDVMSHRGGGGVAQGCWHVWALLLRLVNHEGNRACWLTHQCELSTTTAL